MYRNVRQAVIMVGGKGTRLRPLTYSRPKPILQVADKPCLGYLIDAFVKGGIEEIILACGYKSQLLVDAIGDGSDRGIKIRYSFEDEPMGTGGAIKLLEDQLDDVFVAANGDVFSDIDLKHEIDTHLDNDADITLALTPVDNPWDFGTACQDETGRIVEFREKPKPENVISNLINSGTYIVNKKMISYIPKGQMYDFSKDLVPQKTAEGFRIWGCTLKGVWMDVGRRGDVIRSNLEIAKRIGQKSWKNATSSTIDGNTYINETAVIEDCVLKDVSIMKGAVIKGCTIFNSVIMPGTTVIGSTIADTVIGQNTFIGKGCMITTSIIGDDTKVDDNSKLDSGGGQ